MKLIDVNIKLEAEKMIIYYFLIDCERPGASRLATSDVSNMNDLGVVVWSKSLDSEMMSLMIVLPTFLWHFPASDLLRQVVVDE
jgi:hypothetical protein